MTQIYFRWDEPHLFDALVALLRREYGEMDIDGQTFYFGFWSGTELHVGAAGGYDLLEATALERYKPVCQPEHEAAALDMAAYDPAMAGCDPLVAL